MMKTMSSREFNQDVSKAKRTATTTPVFITDRGQTSHVLLSINEYRVLQHHNESLTGQFKRISSEVADIEFEPPKTLQPISNPADLSD